MKKQILKSALIAVAGVGLLAGSAMADNDPSYYTEWETVVATNAVNSIDNLPVAGSDGSSFYIWATDATLKTWNIAWSSAARVNFSGEIVLIGLDTSGVFDTLRWEPADNLTVYLDNIVVDTDVVEGDAVIGDYGSFSAYTKNGYDIVTVTFTEWTSPSYIGFDLGIGSLAPALVAQNTYLGSGFSQTIASLQSIDDDDFKIAAPIPEPATMLLFGTGLVGLASLGRRKRN